MINTKGLVVAGMGGGSGKSIVAVGLAAALARKGRAVVPYKKGPDYIDSGWLSLAAGRPCYNLDYYLMEDDKLKQSFYRHSAKADIVIVEGNRGLYDGVDTEGSFSTAELALSLNLPVLLVVDCTKTTRTVAAMVLGCRNLDQRIDIRGVVLNRIGTSRHEQTVRGAVEKYTDVPVLGAIHRSKKDVFPQRHLGITPGAEHDDALRALDTLAERAERYLDLDRIEEAMAKVSKPKGLAAIARGHSAKTKVRIGVIRDAAFQFYYQENLEALETEGAELVMINALSDVELPDDIDALYIGGGFPETSARELSANESFRASIKLRAEAGLPIYAECGGLIFLGRSIRFKGETYPLTNVFPVDFSLEKKPQAHGYTVLEATRENPFYPISTEIKGHEFRYSKILQWDGDPDQLVFTMKRGVGFVDGRDGLAKHNVFALYTHIHAVGTPQWAKGVVAAAKRNSEK